jgi:dihydroorotate dehydrogenase electron transfer subunit
MTADRGSPARGPRESSAREPTATTATPPPTTKTTAPPRGGDRPLAPFGRRLLRVTGNDQLGAYRVLRVADPGERGVWAGERAPAPGQFAMLAAAERWGGGEDERPHLPRAFSFARITAKGEAHFLLEDVGPGTRRLCQLRAGEGVWLLGPLGAGFTPPADGRRAILVGGGAGIAPLAIWQDALLTSSAARATAPPPCVPDLPAVSVPDLPAVPASVPSTPLAPQTPQAPTVLLGFRDREHAEGAALLRDAQVATDDGSLGHHGRVTELLANELDGGPRLSTPPGSDPHVTVYACGPAPMLESVRALCAERSLPAQLALESGMACGFGACFGCVVPRREGGYLRVCVDGPVIDASELDRVDAHAGAPS